MAQTDQTLARAHLHQQGDIAHNKDMTDVPIVVRNLRFALDNDIPRNWMGQPPSVTLFVDHLSMVFPAGERFFIASVKAFDKRITDPKLKDDMRRFYQQEAMHTREHLRFNEVLDKHGHPVDAIDRSAKRILTVAKWTLPARMQLSVTCALEHYTAMLAQVLLGDDSILQDAHPTMAALWRWHAAEENEHASVAFDVFTAMGGTYLERAIGMLLVTVFFWAKMLEHQVRMMGPAGMLFSPRAWLDLGRMVVDKPGLLFKLWRPYWAYFKPGFHPRELDCTELLDRWKADFDTLPAYAASQPARAA